MRSAFGFGAAFVFVAAASAQVTIPASASIGPVPGVPGDGLNGDIWSSYSPSIVGSEAIIAAGPSAGQFCSTLVDYPRGAEIVLNVDAPLSEFLGSDADTLMGLQPTVNTAATTWLFTGFIAIANPGELTFGLLSDDGFRLRIAGETVTSFDGDRGPGFSFGAATFESAGLYPIELLYWANEVGISGVQLDWSGPSTINYGNSGLAGLVPTEVLYKVPGPGSAAVAAVACMTLMVRRRRVS